MLAFRTSAHTSGVRRWDSLNSDGTRDFDSFRMLIHDLGDTLDWFQVDAAFQPVHPFKPLFCLNCCSSQFDCLRPSWARAPRRSALKRNHKLKKHQRLRFADLVGLHFWDERGSKQGQTQVSIHTANEQFRALWHLHGQCGEIFRFEDVSQKWGLSAMWGPACPCFSRCERPTQRGSASSTNHWLESYGSAIIRPNIDGWDELAIAMSNEPATRFLFVDLWYLDTSHYRVCIRSRRMLLDRQMSVEEFQRKAIFIWSDLIDHSQGIRFVQVSPKPQSFWDSIAHFILFQDSLNPGTGVVLHSASPDPIEQW